MRWPNGCALRPRRGLRLEIVKHATTLVYFKLLPRRWFFERIFAWLGRFRRPSADYENSVLAVRILLYIAMINIMLRRLAR